MHTSYANMTYLEQAILKYKEGLIEESLIFVNLIKEPNIVERDFADSVRKQYDKIERMADMVQECKTT